MSKSKNDKPRKSRGAAEKERLFAERYVATGKAPDAYREAYGCLAASRENLSSRAKILLNRASVQKLIAEIRARQTAEFDVSVMEIKKALAVVVRKGLRDVPTKQGMRSENLQAVVAACNELNRMAGNHAPAKGQLVDDKGEDALSAFAAAVSQAWTPKG